MGKRSLDVLFEDGHYVAVMKPAGVPAIPGRDGEVSLLEIVAGQLGLPWEGSADPRVRVLHRLDKETSGVTLFAKDREAQRHVSEQFRKNMVHKEYVALVVGRPEIKARWRRRLGRIRHRGGRRMIVTKEGRMAKTEWRVEEKFRGVSLVRCWPRTGKTHQIRVHMKHVGAPLLIDPIYNPGGVSVMLSSFKRGYRAGAEGERALIERLTLHAEKLRFVDMRGEEVEVVAEWPKDLRAGVNMLRKYNS